MTAHQAQRIVIAGGTGFLGRPLVRQCVGHGDEVTLLARSDRRAPHPVHTVTWVPDGSIGAWAKVVDGADVVINLSGESITGRRWTEAHKRRVLDSRLLATRSLVAAISAAAHPPGVLLSGSAVGYYGPRGDERVTEDTPAGHDFLADVCVQWEAAAMRAASRYTRVVVIRTGLALERSGGALAAMLPPFLFGVGGPVGSGRQYWPWIHRNDWLSLVQFAIETPAVQGPLNATAPTPVTNREFATALGRAMHRPSLMPAPAFALRLLLGEVADALLLSGQRAVPHKAQQLGFQFAYMRIGDALEEIMKASGSGLRP